MTLYEIDKSIYDFLETGFNECCVDFETGEIDQERANLYLEALQLERENKLESLAMYIKSLQYEAYMLKMEENALKARRELKERKAERLKEFLKSSILNANETKFETAKVAISFRASKSVECDIDKLDERFIKTATVYSPDKVAIKKAIESGEDVKGAYLKENKNLILK